MSSKIDKTRDKSKWHKALQEAERQISQYKRKIFELNSSVQIIQDKIAAGEPWPGEHRQAQ